VSGRIPTLASSLQVDCERCFPSQPLTKPGAFPAPHPLIGYNSLKWFVHSPFDAMPFLWPPTQRVRLGVFTGRCLQVSVRFLDELVMGRLIGPALSFAKQ
jgi:hypothetical protein